MSDSRLFTPLKIGNMDLKHRMVMAPLTRYRADDNHVPLPFVKEYYGQRASTPGTFLISEATFISPRAAGFSNVPGIWSKEQITAWKNITGEVHSKGSFIYMQMWALGRVADPQYSLLRGIDVVSSSATPADNENSVPRELTKAEIQDYINDYAQAAKNAIEAGFDGVEIHGANGYLVDQFTQDNCNRRTDEYGGSIETRSRFALEVASAVVDAVGADKVGIRLSPWSTFQGMRMKDPIPQFTNLIKGLRKLKLSYLHVTESRANGNADVEPTDQIVFAVDAWQKTSPVLIAGGYRPASAKTAVDEDFKHNDVAIVFGRFFISTPDLPYRIKNGLELKRWDRKTFYKAQTPEGYIDYPFSERFQKEMFGRARARI